TSLNPWTWSTGWRHRCGPVDFSLGGSMWNRMTKSRSILFGTLPPCLSAWQLGDSFKCGRTDGCGGIRPSRMRCHELKHSRSMKVLVDVFEIACRIGRAATE